MYAKGAPQTATKHDHKTNHDNKKATILSYVYIPTLIYGINRENLDLNK